MNIQIFADESSIDQSVQIGQDKQLIQNDALNKSNVDTSNFHGLGVNPHIVSCLNAHQITIPTKIQQLAIPSLLNASISNVVIAPTSSGKTLTFLIPIVSDLQQNPIFYHSIILAPTRELAYQINEQFNLYLSGFGLYSSLFVGGQGQMEDNQVLDSGCYVMVCTAKRLLSCLRSRPRSEMIERFEDLKYLVIDEADMFLNGDDDDKTLKDILTFLPSPLKRVTTLTTASFSDQMKALVNNSRFTVIKDGETIIPKNLDFSYILTPRDFYRSTFLLYLVSRIWGISSLTNTLEFNAVRYADEINNEKVLGRQSKNPALNFIVIFVNTVLECELVNRLLLKYHFPSCNLHGSLDIKQRIRNLAAFKAGKCRILVATDLVSRGLDLQSVEYVINYQMPQHIEDFQHRAGRCARRHHAEKKGEVITLLCPEEWKMKHQTEIQLDIKINRMQKIWNFNTNSDEILNTETIIKDYFPKTIRAECQFRLQLIDEDVGQRIQKRNQENNQKHDNCNENNT